MIPIASPATADLASQLASYERRATIARVAALLTVPGLHANTVRLELLAHLAVANCQGKNPPRDGDLEGWLTTSLGRTELALLEDPPEDVFVANIETPEGNRRIFQGVWESNDYFVQTMLDTMLSLGEPTESGDLLPRILALLRLSDTVADRLQLSRWHAEASSPTGPVQVRSDLNIAERAKAVTFTDTDLTANNTSRTLLSPFILRQKDRQRIMAGSLGNSSLERRPLVDVGGCLVLSVPSAIGPAIRRFLATTLLRLGYSEAFDRALAMTQGRQVETDCLDRLREDSESISPPDFRADLPPLHSWLVRYDLDKYVHVVLLHDRLEWHEQQGFANPLGYPDTTRENLQRYIHAVARHTLRLPHCALGITLIVLGGLGRGLLFSLPTPTPSWCISSVRLPDLIALSSDLRVSLSYYLKFITQKAWVESQGVVFPTTDFNLYSYWRRTNYQLIPRDIPVGPHAMVAIGPEFSFYTREHVRTLADPHLANVDSTSFARVMRFGMDAYFTSLRRRPIYVSLTHLRSQVLAGVVETTRGYTWLIAATPASGDQARRIAYELWSGFLGLFDSLVLEVEASLTRTADGSLSVHIDLSDLAVPEDGAVPAPQSSVPELDPVVAPDRRSVTIKYPPSLALTFHQPSNLGERRVVRALAHSVFILHGTTPSDSELTAITDKAVGDRARLLHVFGTLDPVDYLLARDLRPLILIPHEDFVFSKLRLSEGCTTATVPSALHTKDLCNEFLHLVVAKIWQQLQTLLRQLDRGDVLRRALAVHEGVIQDRTHWHRTAQAVIALHESSEDVVAVAHSREYDRSNAALSARTILEMAVCECPAANGRHVSRWDLDRLLAMAALLVELATDSDAVHSDLIDPVITLWPNGEYTLDRHFLTTVVRPFAAAHFRDTYYQAADDYPTLYKQSELTPRLRLDEIYSADFVGAFAAEFKLTPDDALTAVVQLMELALEANSVVAETTVGEIRRRLLACGLSDHTCIAFLDAFTLFHRPSWEDRPPGFSRKDLSPWRYGRRLSVTVRPMLAFGKGDGDVVLYGLGTLRQGFAYLLDRAERGQMPTDFFGSNEMKAYIGSASNQRGHAFAESVAEALRRDGWHVRTSVKMTELGASAELGDIDVLAWRSPNTVQLIECKRLQLTRTLAEIAEILRRFRGEAKDQLARHIRRVEWVKRNPDSLSRIVGFPVSVDGIDARVVTNTHVPLTYLTSLPIPAEKIGPLPESE